MRYNDIAPGYAGIYLFKNKINGKCYVGQGVDLRKRIKHHISNLKNDRYDLPLYRAFKKYGIHNFDLILLEQFIPDTNDTEQLIKKLDELEIKYIEQYKGYTEGYNCTKGGDYGVLGLKMTDSQKQKIKENNKKIVEKLYKPVYAYNPNTKETIYAISITAMSNILKIHRSSIIRACSGKYGSAKGWICANTYEELEDKKINYKQYKSHYNTVYNVKVYFDGKLEFEGSAKEVAKKYKCSISTVYNTFQRNIKLLGTYDIERNLITT